MSLPLVALPHIITPSLALSLLGDILPRLSHSHAVIRKKAVVSLYRLALVYPEALRLAWPKIKERLMDDQEESSVTAAVINVVCELGWRRPQDFLALAPRLFDLLVDGGNNWMAIKIIKLVRIWIQGPKQCSFKLITPIYKVCDIDAFGTEINPEADPAIDQYHPYNVCHVATLRMYKRCHSGRHFGRSRRNQGGR